MDISRQAKENSLPRTRSKKRKMICRVDQIVYKYISSYYAVGMDVSRKIYDVIYLYPILANPKNHITYLYLSLFIFFPISFLFVQEVDCYLILLNVTPSKLKMADYRNEAQDERTQL
jgi:hypothetical protein